MTSCADNKKLRASRGTQPWIMPDEQLIRASHRYHKSPSPHHNELFWKQKFGMNEVGRNSGRSSCGSCRKNRSILAAEEEMGKEGFWAHHLYYRNTEDWVRHRGYTMRRDLRGHKWGLPLQDAINLLADEINCSASSLLCYKPEISFIKSVRQTPALSRRTLCFWQQNARNGIILNDWR